MMKTYGALMVSLLLIILIGQLVLHYQAKVTADFLYPSSLIPHR
ncbi:hypothetical protein [Serratia oryzae]|nr:hypothetical protein [Serratia oryzae]